MKKIFFFLLLLPFCSIAQKNYLRNKSFSEALYTDSIRVNRSDTIRFIMNIVSMNIEWLNKMAPVIYPKIETCTGGIVNGRKL